MKGINQGRPSHARLKPYQVFDLIGGTSTGGLIAVMLGRLKMSATECKEAYLRLSERIFRPKRIRTRIISRGKDLWQAKGRFDASELEEAIKETINSCDIPDKERFKDLESPCKVFVCAIPTGNAYSAALFRTYSNSAMPDDSYSDCYTWEACRATSAATTFFDPITIGPLKQSFADGAVAYNNPIQLVYREAQQLWPDRIKDALLITIGTGAAPGPSFEGSAMKVVAAMKKIVTETEKTNYDFSHDHSEMLDSGRLYRFNVLQGVASVRLEEYKEIGKITEATRTYLNDPELRSKYRRCVDQLKLALSDALHPHLIQDLEEGGKETGINIPIISDVLPLRVPHFFGRETELQMIQQLLHSIQRSRKTVVLYGLSGFGKTQLALNYWFNSASTYKARIWIDASSLETVFESIKDISSKLDTPHSRIPASESPTSVLSALRIVLSKVRKWLSDPKNAGWLLIIDNVEDLDGPLNIQELVPDTNHGKVLVTTTRQETVSIFEAESIEIRKIDDIAAAELLTYRFEKVPYSEDVKKLISDIVVKLQGVPLAIEQAGAYLSIYKTLSSELLVEFIQKLQSEYPKILSTIPKRSQWYYEKHRSIVDTFALLREALSHENKFSERILSLSVMLGPGQIPMSIFNSKLFTEQRTTKDASYIEKMAQEVSAQPQFLAWAEDIRKDSYTCHAAIKTLEDYCCAKTQWNHEGTEIISFSIHNAVRQWCKESWTSDKKDEVAILAAFHLSRLFHSNIEPAFITRQRYLGHARYSGATLLGDEIPSCAKPLEGLLWSVSWSTLVWLGKFYSQQRFFLEAEHHFKKAIEIEIFSMNEQWPNNETSIRTLHLLALVYYQQGKLEEAVETYQTLCSAAKTVCGSEDELTIQLAEESTTLHLRVLSNNTNWNRAVLATTHEKRDHITSSQSVPPMYQTAQCNDPNNESEEYRLAERIIDAANTFGKNSFQAMNIRFDLASFYASNGQILKAARIADVVWRFRVTNSVAIPRKDMLDAFFICLKGILFDGHSTTELLREYPNALRDAILDSYYLVIDTLLWNDAIDSEWLSHTVSRVDENGESPLYIAIKLSDSSADQDLRIVQRLLTLGADLDYHTARGTPLLHVATLLRQPSIVQILLDHGALPEMCTQMAGATALHYAVFVGNVELIEIFLAYGLGINVKTEVGLTPLHLAVLCGDPKIVQLLLRHGANPNAQTLLGATPLHEAAILSFIYFCLIDHSAFEKVVSELHVLLREEYATILTSAFKLAQEVLEVIWPLAVECGDLGRLRANFEASSIPGSSFSILEDLVQSGAQVELRCVHLRTPLHLALAADLILQRKQTRPEECVWQECEHLLLLGADPEAKDEYGLDMDSVISQHKEYLTAEELSVQAPSHSRQPEAEAKAAFPLPDNSLLVLESSLSYAAVAPHNLMVNDLPGSRIHQEQEPPRYQYSGLSSPPLSISQSRAIISASTDEDLPTYTPDPRLRETRVLAPGSVIELHSKPRIAEEIISLDNLPPASLNQRVSRQADFDDLYDVSD